MIRNHVLDMKSKYFSKHLNEDVINLLDKTFIIPDSFTYEVFNVTEEYIARPDLISLQFYNMTDYGDLLCKINGISNPFELNKDTMLIIPNINDIANFYYNDKQYVEEDSKNNDKPVAKKSTEKRKANEAVISDTRFKIDSKNRIIIY